MCCGWFWGCEIYSVPITIATAISEISSAEGCTVIWTFMKGTGVYFLPVAGAAVFIFLRTVPVTTFTLTIATYLKRDLLTSTMHFSTRQNVLRFQYKRRKRSRCAIFGKKNTRKIQKKSNLDAACNQVFRFETKQSVLQRIQRCRSILFVVKVHFHCRFIFRFLFRYYAERLHWDQFQ